MIYAKDQWVQLPVKDLYDSQIMLASINAAKDMYEKGVNEMKDFQRAYGEFYSPIQRDMDWYNKNIIQGSKDVINKLYDRGIDPLRSAEGRASISRFINNLPLGDINKLKMGSKIAQEYLRNRGILEAQNKYNNDYESWANGGKTLDNWDTLRDGMWTRQSPAEFTTLKQATENWFNNRTPHSLTQAEVESFGMPYDKRYDYQGYSNTDLLNVAARNTPGWSGSPIADYYRDLSRRQLIEAGIANPTTQQINDQLQRSVANANREWLVAPIRSANDYAKMDAQYNQQLKMQARQFAQDEKMLRLKGQQDRANFWFKWKLENRNPNGASNPDGSKQMPLTLTQMQIISSNQNKRDRLIGGDRFNTNTKAISDYWLGKANTILGKADRNGDGKIDKTEAASWTNAYKKLTPSQKKQYDSYAAHYNWWNNANKQGLEGAIKNGLVDSNGNVTDRLVNAITTVTKQLYSGKSYKPGQNQALYGSYYNDVAPLQNSQATKVILGVLSNGKTSQYYFPSNDPKKQGTYGKAHPVVNFSDKGVYFGNVRAHAVSTHGKLSNGSISMKFQKFLKESGTQGWVVSNSGLGTVVVPNRGKGSSLDIVAKVSVPYNTISAFARSVGGTANGVLNALGLRRMDRSGASNANGGFVEIPISKQLDNNGGQGYSQIDQEYDKAMYGGKEAAERELQQQFESSQR